MSNSADFNQFEWRSYIAERDELFLKSRSVSVTEMATTLAHELNQPLGTVSNILQGLKVRIGSEGLDVEKFSNALDMALEQTQFAACVVSKMRSFTESREPDHVSFNVVDALNQSVRLLDWVFNAESVRIVLSGANSSAKAVPSQPVNFDMQGDRTMIQQVFTNLLRNAVDALREIPIDQRTIRISLDRVPEGIKVEIEDAGHGLKGVSSEDLFQAFKSTKSTGMGVGLSICRSFIELHQGKIWLSQNPTCGCTAHIILRATTSGEGYE